MTGRNLVIILGFVVVIVSSAGAEECPQGNCTSPASHNNEIERLSTSQEVITQTTAPLPKPQSLDMLAEDSYNVFRPSPNPSSELNTVQRSAFSKEEPKGRALNFTVDEHHAGNILSNFSKHHDDFDLSDVTIGDDEDFDMDLDHHKMMLPKSDSKNSTFGLCEKGGLTYENGEKLENGCDSVCTCKNGNMDCDERCPKPFFRKGKKIDDPLCSAKATEDPCCSVLVCAGDTETEPLEICSYENQTYNRGDIFNKGCAEVCSCEIAGKVYCKSRCPPSNKTNDRCVEVPDPNDSCCKKILCDVTLDDNDPEKYDESHKRKILSAKFVNETTILMKFDSSSDDDAGMVVEISDDKTTWRKFKIVQGGYVLAKRDAKYLRLENTDDIINIQNFVTDPKPGDKTKNDSKGCQYKGQLFKLGDEFNDECTALCVCQEGGMKCLKIQCPTYFGVDVLDPNCVEWETIPPDFTPTPPKCCPERIRCKNNGSCNYKGATYKNWEQVPINITGCEKRCYCEMGHVECQNTCPPVTALPPPNLPCPQNLAKIGHIPEDDCCKYWVCNPDDAETLPNETENDKGHTKTPTETSYKEYFTPKTPSKILGPLVVYENKVPHQTDSVNELGHVPTLEPEENPFNNKSISPVKYNTKPNVLKEKINNYLGPFGPTNVDKSKIKKGSIFVTPHPPLESVPPQEENNIFSPSKSEAPIIKPNHNSDHSEIEVHGQGNPDDLLQFINQHPEISDYPSGSVLEIHSLPPTSMPKPGKQQIHLVPYVVPQNGEHVNNDLPPGFSLEHILREFHKNSRPQANLQNPFSPFNPITNNNNRPFIIGHQSGPNLLNKLNSTFPGFDGPLFPGPFPPPQDDVPVHTLEAIDPHTVRLAFMVPPVIVNLHGRVEVRYTNDKDDADLDSWMLQVFAPPNDLIATRSLEFDLQDLESDTEYKIKITITLRDIHTTHSSRIYKIKTPREILTSTLPPMIPIEPDLAIIDINATWVTVTWKKFDANELRFIDGVQLRYREIEGKIYAATPLIHRAVTTYTLENLKPNTKYEIGIFFIPFPGQLTELHAEKMLHFTTANEIDTYGFNVTLEISHIKSQSVEISWEGVPYPEDKYVNIYRAIYQSDTGKEDQSMFKIAKRDSATKTVIMDLKPGTRYRLWLEVYLTNGKIKTSNVQEFNTKPRVAPVLGAASQQDKLSRAYQLEMKGDYYGPLVIVAILAAIAIMSTLVLLLILIRRHNQNKAAITPPSRVSQSAYDNPTYKVEIQQETMGKYVCE
ncbi:stranded at second isoform X1 [Leptinotarsa decemlineata]|uniref:stranded at second isoform X1 n=1 Tax=Leptinotarsa decemlineata TaxID=7539 RepID=UPI003D304EAE